MLPRWTVGWLALACGACSATPEPVPQRADAGEVDAPVDAEVDAGPLPTYGRVSGRCSALGAELDDESSSLRSSRFELEGVPLVEDEDALAEGTLTILASENAGGSSRYSEAFVFELLSRCIDAELVATENDITYEPSGARTDFLVLAEGERVGVSVARAIAYPFESSYSEEQAASLLEDKLAGIIESSATVVAEQAWRKQILGLMAYGDEHAAALFASLDDLPVELRADTVVWVITTDGDDGFVYCDGPCGL